MLKQHVMHSTSSNIKSRSYNDVNEVVDELIHIVQDIKGI